MNEDDQSLFGSWQREQEHVQTLKDSHPELFNQNERQDPQELLKTIGITLPNTGLPLGYIKLTPLDFIVEEILPNNRVVTVNIEDTAPQENEVGQTVYADLVKVGISSLEAEKELARRLNIDLTNIGKAGIKDATALTAQMVSIKGINPETLKNLETGNIFLKNIHTGKGVLSSGALLGNRFTILIRTETAPDEEQLFKNLKKINTDGFYNFYWTQRFGNRLLSHEWGMMFLRGAYQKLVRSYLFDHGPAESTLFRDLRERAQKNSGNWNATAKLFSSFPYSLRHEIILAEYLDKNPSDYVGALLQMPEQIKLWVYAYSSFLANQKLSEYAKNNDNDHKTIPLLLSNLEADRKLYDAELKRDNIPKQFEQHLKALKHHVRLNHNEIPVVIKPKIHSFRAIKQGIIINFDLPKGAYATSLLSQLFGLVEGLPLPEWVNKDEVDLKEQLNQPSLAETKKHLQNYIISKADITIE